MVEQRHRNAEDMIHAELERPFLTDEDLSAFGEGCTKVLSDLGTFMYIATRPAGAGKVSETLVDEKHWTDHFQAKMPQRERDILMPDEVSPHSCTAWNVDRLGHQHSVPELECSAGRQVVSQAMQTVAMAADWGSAVSSMLLI